MILVSGHGAAVVADPSEEALDLPSPLASAQFSAVLGGFPLVIASVRRDELHALLSHLSVQLVTIISTVSNHALRHFPYEARQEHIGHELHFMGACSVGPYGDRKTSSVCDDHDLGAFASLGRSNIKPPFLALEKAPSMKHSVMSIVPRSRRSKASLNNTLSHTPALLHCWW